MSTSIKKNKTDVAVKFTFKGNPSENDIQLDINRIFWWFEENKRSMNEEFSFERILYILKTVQGKLRDEEIGK